MYQAERWLAGMVGLALAAYLLVWFVGHFFKVMAVVVPFYRRQRTRYNYVLDRNTVKQAEAQHHLPHERRGSSLDPDPEAPEDEDD